MQDRSFTSLDAKVQQNIEALLPRLIDMYSKLEALLALQEKSLEVSKTNVLADKRKNKVKRDVMVNEFVLASLRFPTIRHREEAICEAHRGHFHEFLDHANR